MKADQKRQRIVDAATALLLKQGVKKTSMEDFAASAGVSKVTVYKYFGDRDGALSAVCIRLTGRCLQAIEEEVKAETNTATRMMAFVRILNNFIQKGEQTLCRELDAEIGSSAAHYDTFESKVREVIFSLIREGKDACLIDKSLSDELVYHYIEMGLCYFQHDPSYRVRMQGDEAFRKAFLHLLWRNIFNTEALQQIGDGQSDG